MSKTLTTLMVGAVGLLLTSFAPGQQPADTPPSETPPAESKGVMLAQGRPVRPAPGSEQPPAPPAGNDPTQPSTRLRDAMLGTAKGPGNTSALKLPLIAIRGRVIAKDKPPAVLLEVDGRVYRIAKGTAMNGPGNTMLKVTELTRSEVTIQVSPQNATTVLDTIVLH